MQPLSLEEWEPAVSLDGRTKYSRGMQDTFMWEVLLFTEGDIISLMVVQVAFIAEKSHR